MSIGIEGQEKGESRKGIGKGRSFSEEMAQLEQRLRSWKGYRIPVFTFEQVFTFG